MARASVDLAQLAIRSISAEDNVSEFSCGTDEADADLNDFLWTDALRYHQLGVVHVYLAIYSGTLVGYAAILTDLVRLKTAEIKKLGMTNDDPPGIPALKIGRLAVSASFRETHRGLGTALSGFCYSIGAVIAVKAGCRLLTVDALPKSEEFYQKLGFIRNKLKPPTKEEHPDPPEDGCISMRFDLNVDPLPSWCL